MISSTAALPPALAAHSNRVTLVDPVFISDLHLNAAQPATLQAFVDFTRGLARQHRELLILGDLFEYWTGDDNGSEPVAQIVAAALRELAGSGTQVYLMQGNRDLLLGRDFCAQAGAMLLADPTLAEIHGSKVLLSHGDAYCTRDAGYMRFRAFTRRPGVQRVFLRLPQLLRQRIAGAARARSKSGKQQKSMQIMDVTPAAIAQALQRAGAERMIHGHTHRPGTHTWQVDQHELQRWVLPDWDCEQQPARGGYLHIDTGQWQVKPLPSDGR